jgi:hypothetical protein
LYVPDSPSDLCRMLRLDPTERQVEVMESLARQTGIVDARMSTAEEIKGAGDDLRAALMVVLWRVLRVPGSRATIVAPSAGGSLASGELGHLAMAFLQEVCKVQDCVLSSICTVRGWHTIEFGTEAGWEIRFCHNVPMIVAEAATRSRTGLVLDAGDACSALGECARELEVIAKEPRGLLIRLW